MIMKINCPDIAQETVIDSGYSEIKIPVQQNNSPEIQIFLIARSMSLQPKLRNKFDCLQ